MSIDRVDPFSAGYGRSGLPPRPGTPPGFAGKAGPGYATDKLSDLGVPIGGAVNKSFITQWGQSAMTYGSHSALAEWLNRAAAPNTPMNKQIQTLADKAVTKLDLGNSSRSKTEAISNAAADSKLLKQTEKNSMKPPLGGTSASDAARAAASAVSYSELLRLHDKQVPISELNKGKLGEAIKYNTQDFRHQVQSGNIKNFFEHTSAKDYFKKTVVAGNIEPVKNLKTNLANNDHIGTGLVRSLVLGLLGYDVVKHTYQTYKSEKAHEDGSFKGKWRTGWETTKAFGKYSVRDGTSWEVAGVGAAIGRALIPIAIGSVSCGGILIGALAGILAQKGLDKLMHTGDHDPHKPPKKPEHAPEPPGHGSRRNEGSGPEYSGHENDRLSDPGGVPPSK